MAEHHGLLAQFLPDNIVDTLNEIPGVEDVWDDGENQTLTEEDKRTLRKVPDTIPKAAFLVAFIELCERFAYYGMSGPFQNYMQNQYPDEDGVPGALGLGQQSATAVSNIFNFWTYTTPVLGAVIADQYLGRYKTIVYFSIIYMIGLFVLLLTSLPSSIRAGFAFWGLVLSMIVIGLGAGGIKSNVSPLIAEQYRQQRPRVATLKSGERVIVDPDVTIQKIYMIFYFCINIGSLSSIFTTVLEAHVGFWSAYLLPLLMFLVGFGLIVLGRKAYVTAPPSGSVLLDAFRVIWIGLRNGRSLDAAKSSSPFTKRRGFVYPWNDVFVEELKRTLLACRVFLFFPVYWVTFGQMTNNFVSQAGTMSLHGIPNDLMQNIDAVSLVALIPLVDRLLYPGLRRFGVAFKPITRIFTGFMLASLAMAYAALLQQFIYGSPPRSVHIAVQAPAYVLIAMSEIFASVSGLEWAYTQAPASMKSFIMSIYLLTTAFGAALAGLVAPFAVDPHLTWLYSGLCLTSFSAGLVFWFTFKGYNEAGGDQGVMHDMHSRLDAEDMAMELDDPTPQGTSGGRNLYPH